MDQGVRGINQFLIVPDGYFFISAIVEYRGRGKGRDLQVLYSYYKVVAVNLEVDVLNWTPIEGERETATLSHTHMVNIM